MTRADEKQTNLKKYEEYFLRYQLTDRMVKSAAKPDENFRDRKFVWDGADHPTSTGISERRPASDADADETQSVESYQAEIDSDGPPLGFVGGASYGEKSMTLAKGDVVLLYTDGVTEATDSELEMFGEERLQELLRRHAAGTAQALLDATLDSLATFAGKRRQDDDVSLLVIKAR